MWIESHQSLRKHPKTLRAARALGVSEVHLIGHLHCLWWWALDYAPDGDLSSYDNADIAAAAEWDGDADTFVAALRDAAQIGGRPGFLELKDDHLCVHDWAEYGGKLVAKREQDAARKRNTRQKDSPQQQQGQTAAAKAAQDVHRTSNGHPADVAGREQDKTGQDKTEQDKRGEDRTPPTRADTRASTDPPRGKPRDGDAAVRGSALSAEQFVAVQFVKRVAPDFRDLETFVRGTEPRLVAYWALAADLDIERLDNPAGLIRAMVDKKEWPDLPGNVIEKWKTAVRTNAWRDDSRNGRLQ